MAGDTVAGSFDVFFVDRSYRLGDSFSGVSGLAIAFNRWPMVIRREFVNAGAAGYRTVMHLSDLRDAPEVAA